MFLNINCLIAATYFWFIQCQAIGCFQGKCYYLGSNIDWNKGRNYCKFHGDLACIHSKEENDFISDHINAFGISAWIGITDEIVEGDFRWVDGSDVTYENWDKYTSVIEWDYGRIQNKERSNKWHAVPYYTNLPPVCETTTTDLPTFYSSVKMTFSEARNYCTSTGGELASIRSQEEHDFIHKHICRNQGCWLGYKFDGNERVYKWLDGSDTQFTNWKSGQPSGTSHASVELFGEWTTESSSTVHHPLCRRNGADGPTKGPRSPTLQPSRSPTERERCSLGLKACESSHQQRLDVSLANEMYQNCRSKCVYDYDKTIANRKAGFVYIKNRKCYDYVKDGTCFKGKKYSKALNLMLSRCEKRNLRD